MPSWKKVLVSGSTANLPSLQVDNLTSGQVVIGAGAGNLTTTAINGTGNIVATTNASGLVHSGSFSGSFQGVFSGSLNGTASYVTGSVHTSTNPALSASYALSSSYALNGGVTQIVAGTNVTISPTNGLGAVTVNAAAGAAFPFTGNAVISGSLQITASSGQLGVTGSASFNGPFTVLGQATINNLTGSLWGTASYVTGSVHTSTNPALSASYALSSSYALSATQVSSNLTAGNGITGTAYNGGTGQTWSIGQGVLITVDADNVMVTTSSLSANQIPKFSSNTLSGSNITDTGAQIQIGAGATSGLSVAAGGVTVSAGGVTVTGNSTFNNNLTVTGNLNVAGTASFTNTDSLFVADKFIALASSSNPTLTQGGIIIITGGAANGSSGSAIFLDNVGTQGRFAVTGSLNTTSSQAINVNEYVVSVTTNQATAPAVSLKPTWGSDTNNTNGGSMWIVPSTGDIFIYS